MKKPLITFEHFTFQYHSQSEPTLHDLNVTIYEGEKILVVGPSGSGKSTFAQCINGLIPNTYEGELQGEVKIGEKSLAETSLFDLSFDVGTVLQDTDGQFIGLTVAEDIAFVLENDAVELSEMKKKVVHWAEVVGLQEHLKHRPQDLSGGQKQRVSMAGVLVNDAPILLFDEPLANLDPAAGKETVKLIEELHKKTDTTILIIEHRLEDVLYQPVDRVLVFNEGRIVADVTPEELLKSNILIEQGIREPLYVTALKYAGVDLSNVENIEDVTKIKGKELTTTVSRWAEQQSIPQSHDSEEDLLTIKNLNFTYQKEGRQILNQLSVTFKKGEMLSIVGENGAGKTTLSKAVCGFITPQSGEMSWQNENFASLSIKERAEKVGYVMQNPNQMISKKMIFDEVALGLVLKNVEPEEIKRRVYDVLKICGLYEFRNWPISALSYGQKKRVTIASILVLNPEMILLDEPTAGQDFKHYTEMMSFLEELNQQGVTVVMITHDMHLMLEYAQRVLVVHDGTIIADTTPVAVLTNQELVEKASLKETSLFTFAQHLAIKQPIEFTEKFISYDREVRLR